MGRPALVTRLAALAGITTLAAVAAFLSFGAVWVAVGVSLASVLVALYSVWSLAPVLRVRAGTILLELAPPAVAAVVMAGLLGAIALVVDVDGGPLVRLALLAVEGIVGVAAYSALLAVIKPTLFRELIDLRRLAGVCRSTPDSRAPTTGPCIRVNERWEEPVEHA